MVSFKQGNIFQEWNAEPYDLMVCFGHDGFNTLSTNLNLHHMPVLPNRTGDASDGATILIGDNK
jgi:hypothetical protein